jgi:hypothetical protein
MLLYYSFIEKGGGGILFFEYLRINIKEMIMKSCYYYFNNVCKRIQNYI